MELLDAVRENDLDTVNRLLLNPRVNVNVTYPNGTTPLILAANNGNTDIGLALIRRGADINKVDNKGATPLFKAVISGNKDFVTLLLEQPDIDVNAQLTDETDVGQTALSGSFYTNADLELIQMLLESGANPNLGSLDETPFYNALSDGKFELAQLLVDYGADVNAYVRGMFPALSLLVRRDNNIDKVKYLLTLPQLDIDKPATAGRTALMDAVSWPGHGPNMAKLLIGAGADPTIKDTNGETALQRVKGDNKNELNLLIDAERRWHAAELKAAQDLKKKFVIARRLRQGVETTAGSRLELSERHLSEGIVRRAEYDNLCMGLQSNLNKPGVVALAKSLKIPTSNLTKTQLCKEIAGKLIL
jgi:ankyrin repeat protein